MQVRLTKEGQKVLGFSPDRKIANVSDDRAFALMSRGFAAQDAGFMSLFDGELPKEKKEKEIKTKTTEDNQKMIDKIMGSDSGKELESKIKPKKEKAVSKKAAKRSKAIKK